MRPPYDLASVLAAALLASSVMACASGSGSSFPEGDDASPATTVGDATVRSPSVDDDDAGPRFVEDAGVGSPTCPPGTYSGSYTGTIDTSMLLGPKDFPISGPMTITLQQSSEQSGEGLVLTLTSDAVFDAVWGVTAPDASTGLVVVHAQLVGQLDCTDGVFSATSADAGWTVFTIPFGMATVDFKGKFDVASRAIGGDMAGTAGFGSGGAPVVFTKGTWNVALQPAADR